MTDTESALNEVAGDDIEKAMNTILPGKDPLDGLQARHEGGLEYVVLSVRDGAPSIHWVYLGKVPTCTCNDYQGNRKSSFDGELGSEREPCAHIVKAVLADQMEPEQLATRELINTAATIASAGQEAKRAAEEARKTARELDNGLVDVRDAQAGATTSDGSNTDSGSTSNGSDSAGSSGGHIPENKQIKELEDKLQSAFDDVLPEMQVQRHDGKLWIQTGKDTPDTLPGPGNVEVFDALLKNPDQTVYAPDDDSPGEWWKNFIEPGDVDDYISEVLQ